jgi:hypothetical protein
MWGTNMRRDQRELVLYRPEATVLLLVFTCMNRSIEQRPVCGGRFHGFTVIMSPWCARYGYTRGVPATAGAVVYPP